MLLGDSWNQGSTSAGVSRVDRLLPCSHAMAVVNALAWRTWLSGGHNFDDFSFIDFSPWNEVPSTWDIPGWHFFGRTEHQRVVLMCDVQTLGNFPSVYKRVEASSVWHFQCMYVTSITMRKKTWLWVNFVEIQSNVWMYKMYMNV